jgi:Ni/Fe-hydrogenase subunit HybB-like protein
MKRDEDYRLGFWKGMFYLLLAMGLVITVVRFTQGLGSVTNLSDRFPWGLWIGFDILCGVGLAAGGFTITAMVYIFNVKRFKPIVRPTVLTAFLGYLLVIVALLYDLGKPWNLWHPLVMGNPHSVMFEVAWCVMLYTTVLALEFSGMVFERAGWKRAVKVQKAFTIPLVVLGVVLSTLHQSSLGALYLIVPGKLHEIWYTSSLPLIFYVSSICAGLAMVIVESRLSARAFGRHLELPLLRDVGRILVAALGVFGVLRIYDLAQRGALGAAFAGTYESAMFQLEFAIGLLLPMVLLAVPRIRASARGLYASSLLVVLGFIVNRLNVSITGLESAQGGHYVPAWSEVIITLMLVALGFGAFSLAVRYFNVYPEQEEPEQDATEGKPPAVAFRPIAGGLRAGGGSGGG